MFKPPSHYNQHKSRILDTMKILFKLLLTILQIFDSNSEKKFLKIYKCEVNEKFAINKRCEVIDGRSFVVYNIIKQINECMVRIIC